VIRFDTIIYVVQFASAAADARQVSIDI